MAAGGARVLAVLGDSVTTDHISPAGSIAATSPATYASTGRAAPPNRLGLARWLIDPRNPLTARVTPASREISASAPSAPR